jgi:hypothetical protein
MFVHEVEFPDIGSRWMHSSGRVYDVVGYSNLKTILEPLQSERREKYPPRIHYQLAGSNDIMDQFSCAPENWYPRMVKL